jgi:hypothetical protein
LVALARFADPTLWFGAACDVALLLIGLWRAYGGWPAHPSHGPRWHAVGVGTGAALIVYVAGTTVLYPWHRTWGSTREELLMPLPGDAADRDPALEMQHAVTIAAPPEEVWPLMTQFVEDRPASYLAPGRAIVLDDRGAFVLVPTSDGYTRFIIRSRAGDRRIPVWSSVINWTTFGLPQFLRERRLMLTVKRLAEEGRARSAALR